MVQGEKDSADVAPSGDRNNEVGAEGNCIEFVRDVYICLCANVKQLDTCILIPKKNKKSG
jgi:hypothetical protein